MIWILPDTTLGALRPGVAAHISGLTPGHPLRRLIELGFIRRAEVSVLRATPPGDPIAW